LSQDEGRIISALFESNAPAVDAVLDRMLSLHPKRIDLSLDRINRLLVALGYPHRDLPPVIHIAGTNGKGSTTAFMRACLEAAGYRVHVYTSPHLVRFNERIRLEGALITDQHLIDVLERSETANAGAEITFFEITTAAAMLAFAETPADVLLLETGLGGRLDTTNVIDRPAMTAITRISMDHMQFLGDSLAEIAAEKAGILKPGVTAVLAPQRSADAVRTIRARAEEVGAALLEYDIDWRFRADAGGVTLETGRRDIRLPLPNLAGAHQIENAMTAALCLDRLEGFAVPETALRQGLVAAQWPARLQRLHRGPLVDAIPEGWELWLDGGHNDSAGEALARWLAEQDGKPAHLVVGILSTKDPRDLLTPLAPHIAGLHALAIPGEPSSLSADALADAAREASIETVSTAASAQAAIGAIVRAETTPSRILIGGSLYLAGVVLSENG